jgi:hypothetical protein
MLTGIKPAKVEIPPGVAFIVGACTRAGWNNLAITKFATALTHQKLAL